MTQTILWWDEITTKIPAQGREYNIRHLPMPRALAFDLFQHEFQHGRYSAHYNAKQAEYHLLQARVFHQERMFERCPMATVIDNILAGE